MARTTNSSSSAATAAALRPSNGNWIRTATGWTRSSSSSAAVASPEIAPVTATATATATVSSLFSRRDLVPLVVFLQNDRSRDH